MASILGAFFPGGNATEVIHGSEASHGWATGEAMDPPSSALKAARNAKVDPGDFRTLDENAQMLRPLVGRRFQVWELKERASRNSTARHDWRLGARLGPKAFGNYSQRVSDLGATSPGIRRAGLGEVVEVIRCPGQVGFPPSVATDAQLGYSVMAYESAEALFGRCEGDGRILARIIGTCASPQRYQRGRYDPARKGGLLTLIRATDPCRCAIAIRGQGILLVQST